MVIGMVVFFVLFAFLCSVTLVIVLAQFTRKTYPSYEPTVSIIIPTYNEEKTIARCLESINTSHYSKEKLDIIVVDDGSTDGTLAEVQKFSSVRIVHQGHHGKVEALNTGLKESRYDIILTLDADTLLHAACIKNIVLPLQDPTIAASSGSCRVANNVNILTMFQNIEYHYNNLIRQSFSRVFLTGIWFFGALACYKKSAVLSVGGFKKDTQTEDADIALEFHRAGYRTMTLPSALGFTTVPITFSGFITQRKRWWSGVLQSLGKNKGAWTSHSPPILFLFVNQYWWSVYAFLSLPLLLYQIHYWFPTGGFIEISSYLIRWFTVAGPFYVLYKLPVWGLSYYNIFGVLAGVVSFSLMIIAPFFFKDTLSLKNIIGVIFYFPYTIFLNAVICLSFLHKTKRVYFIK